MIGLNELPSKDAAGGCEMVEKITNERVSPLRNGNISAVGGKPPNPSLVPLRVAGRNPGLAQGSQIAGPDPRRKRASFQVDVGCTRCHA